MQSNLVEHWYLQYLWFNNVLLIMMWFFIRLFIEVTIHMPLFTLSLPILGVLDTDRNAIAKRNYCPFSLDNPNPNLIIRYPFWEHCIQSKDNWLTWHIKFKNPYMGSQNLLFPTTAGVSLGGTSFWHFWMMHEYVGKTAITNLLPLNPYLCLEIREGNFA